MKKCEEQLETLQAKNAQDLWTEDLESFTKMYEKFMKDYDVSNEITTASTYVVGKKKPKLTKKELAMIIPDNTSSQDALADALLLEIAKKKSEQPAQPKKVAVKGKK